MEVLKCENCGNEHDGSYGSGRFCSKNCKCSYAGKNVKNRKSNLKFLKDTEYKNKLREKNLLEQRWKCPHCGECFATRKLLYEHTGAKHAKYDENGKRLPWNTGLTKSDNLVLKEISEKLKNGYKNGDYTPSFKGKTHTEETKKLLSIKKKEFLENNPDKHPYKRFTHKNGKSYAEDYFENWLKKENFQFESELGIGRYSCDFLVNGVYDLEIDGQFHKNDPKKVEIDKRKTEFLLSRGIKTIRVYWHYYSKLSADEKERYLSELKLVLNNKEENESLKKFINELLESKQKACIVCGKKFNSKNEKFCSKKCYDDFQRTSIPEDFSENLNLTTTQLSKKYKVSRRLIDKWKLRLEKT